MNLDKDTTVKPLANSLSCNVIDNKFVERASGIDSWLQSKDTIEFLGVWELLNNPGFNSVEFDRIRLDAGTNMFRLSVKRWSEDVRGVGVIAKAGRYGGTFAH